MRVKSVLELRGADVVPMPLLMALPALWVGLLYDAEARAGATALTAGWSFAERVQFQAQVAQRALAARGPAGESALELGRELLSLARAGLRRFSPGDAALLDPAAEIAESGVTLAERALQAWQESNGDPESLVRLWQMA